MSRLIDVWIQFVESLNSRGGTIALLFMCNLGLVVLMLHIMHTGNTTQAATAVIATFSNFTGGLLVALSSRDKSGNGNGNGNGNVVPSNTTTEEKK